MAKYKVEIKVTFNGQGYRAYVKGRGISSTCTRSPKEAATKAARKALGDVPFTMKERPTMGAPDQIFTAEEV